MKKIFDWTVGSFFRTIGRTIAFLIMGGIIYYILTTNGFGIEDLFFDRVNASGYTSKDFTWYNNGSVIPSFVGWPDGYSGYRVDTDYHHGTLWFNATNNGGYVSIPDGSKKVTINAILDLPISQEYDNGIIDAMSSNFLEIQLITNGLWSTCTVSNQIQNTNTNNLYNVECPIQNGVTSIHSVTVYYNLENVSTWQGYIGLGRRLTFELSETQTIIDNQNQNTQTIIENQQNQTEQLLEDNTTEAENEISNFLGNFTVEDFGGLSSIITAPLNTLNSLLTSSCTNLVLPLPFVNKNLTLPCMNTIYNTHFGLFFNLYQTIILAIVSYRCIRSIYFDIHGFTNPDDDRIEVMDL